MKNSLSITIKRSMFVMLNVMFLYGCETTSASNPVPKESERFTIEQSYLSDSASNELFDESKVFSNESDVKSSRSKSSDNGFTKLESLEQNKSFQFSSKTLNTQFNETDSIELSVEEMPIRQFMHYVFGELLQVNYVIDESITNNTSSISINIDNAISSRQLFDLSFKQLVERDIQIRFDDGVYYIIPKKGKNFVDVVVSIGRNLDDVPFTSQQLLQIVPIKYGIRQGLINTLKQLAQADVNTDYQQNVLFIRGTRSQILRALEFIQLLDAPSMRGKELALLEFTYINSTQFTENVEEILKTEGIPVGIKSQDGKNVIIIPIERIGAAVVFATDSELLNRVKYWAKILDKPSKGEDAQFYTFKPKFARALDIGESLQKLLSDSIGNSSQKRSDGGDSGNAPTNQSNVGTSVDGFRMVVDERTNSIILHTSGTKYQSIMPILNELDVLPKQIFLDITIAEVTMQDEFKFGVEFALEQNANLTLSTLGAFGASSLGGLSMVYQGAKGPLTANLLETSSLVKVLSKPTLLVRDGMTASVNIGSQISVVGATTSDPINSLLQTTTTEYRDTGVQITVTPTVNADDIVIMKVIQSISNTIPSSNGAGGNPDIFNRDLETEVIAKSGQTILLAGLISEDINNSESETPLLGRIPLFGKLFGSQGNTKNRTELVMLITPRVMEDLNEWDSIKLKLQEGVNYLKF